MRTALSLVLPVLAAQALTLAVEQQGQITFNGLPVPGATITATRGEKIIAATSNEDGAYRLSGLDDGVWTITVEMLGFAPVSQQVTIADNSQPATFELTLLPFEEMRKVAVVSAAEAAPYTSSSAQPPASAPGGATAGRSDAASASLA